MWRSIRVKIVVVYLLLILFALELIGAYFVRSLTSSLIRSDTESVRNQAQLLATIAGPEIDANGQASTSILSSFPKVINGVVYILDKDGVVRDTSVGSRLIGQKRVDSVATQSLVGHKEAIEIHYDSSNSQHLVSIAVPMFDAHQFVGIVECVVPIQNTYTTVREATTIFYTASGLVLTLTALLGVILSRTITRPVLDVTRQARNMAAGNFAERVQVHSDDEFGDLSEAINDLTDKLEHALAENERERERLQAVIKYMGDGVIAFNAALHVMFRNDAAQRLVPANVGSAARALGLTDIDLSDTTAHMYLRHFGDTMLHVHVSTIGSEGEVEGYVALIRDVTEQEKLQNARRDFVANVSHELRTPLTSIKSYIEALQDLVDDEETRDRFLKVIEQEADRMVRLTEDLLQVSGLEMRKTTYTESVVDVTALLTEATERMQLEAQSRGVKLTTRCRRPAAVKGDHDLLDRLLDNLISNALKYTPEGGSVEVTSGLSGDLVRIRVADTGIGIPQEDLPHVFERFYRVDKARSRRMGGTGLGLSLAREITERHGGTISIASEVNKGTTVSVTLPLYEEGSA